jgi:hypothetical protein
MTLRIPKSDSTASRAMPAFSTLDTVSRLMLAPDRRTAIGFARSIRRPSKRFIIRAIWRLWQECRLVSNRSLEVRAA